MKILICGLPGSGKTWLAERLNNYIDNSSWFNADIIRKKNNDWDFSPEGRKRQAGRMKSLADTASLGGEIAICDFVAPTKDIRETFNPDYLIWLDTVEKGRVVSGKKEELKDAKELPFDIDTLEKSKEFQDTNNVFDPPLNAQKIIKSFLTDEEIKLLAAEITSSV
tara:strand:- start:79 stop:576 length:498 start_codon:yes stop_codon:yes gene_type:complete